MSEITVSRRVISSASQAFTVGELAEFLAACTRIGLIAEDEIRLEHWRGDESKSYHQFVGEHVIESGGKPL